MDAFSGRVAIVTGGAGGIGMAMARAFATRGAKLVLADLDEAALARAAGDLRGAGATVHTVRTDVGELAQVEALADETFRHYGAAHIVCNNAGIALFGEMAHATHKDWDYTMRVNFWGVVHGVEAFVPRLIAQKAGGHVVNTASMAGLVGMQWLGIYCASKFAVVGLSEGLNRELAPHGIGVSVLCPMIVETNINANSLRNRPAALRNPDHTDAPPDIEAGSMVGSVIQPDEVGRRVARAIDRNDLYILTHPEQREILRRRARRQDQMFEPDRW